MEKVEIYFKIIEENNCPLYNISEKIILSDRAITCPAGKGTCLILVREMTELLFSFIGDPDKFESLNQNKLFSCSGCTGLIKFQRVDPGDEEDEDEVEIEIIAEQIDAPGEEPAVITDPVILDLLDTVVAYPVFAGLSKQQLLNCLTKFRKEQVPDKSILIHKDEPGRYLYIILSGEVLVEDGPLHITSLGPGEICGEMSFFGDCAAGASVRSVESTEVLSITGESFLILLEETPSIQLYMARLLANRLSRANQARAQGFDSCMQGRLDLMVPAELFQIFHFNKKTGMLMLDLTSGSAKVAFREGCIIYAEHNDQENQEAIFSILAERHGTYTFSSGLSQSDMKSGEIGDFMGLLMEGIKRIDEEVNA